MSDAPENGTIKQTTNIKKDLKVNNCNKNT